MPMARKQEMYNSECKVALLPSRMVLGIKWCFHLRGTEYLIAVLDNKLHSVVFGMHVGHFSLKAMISHDRRCEDHGKILRCHL
jgi:hypothetical protein